MDQDAETASEDRYARHRLIDWWDQERLANARVLVAGAGAIGGEVIRLLALLGVGRLLIVDFDRIELSNLTRSSLFRAGDVGQSKALVAAERARELNPDITVHALNGNLEYDVGLGVYRAMDVVIGGLDSINARLALNRACRRAGVPWLNGGIEATIAEVALFGNEEGACFECAMSDSMWEARNQRFSCSGLQNAIPEQKMPTTATVATIAAGYLVNEALFLLHQTLENPKSGLNFSQKLYIMLKPYGFHVMDLPANPCCLAHERWKPVEILARGAQELTPRRLLTEVGWPEGAVELGFDLLAEMHCLECGRTEEVFRPVETCAITLNQCPYCQAESRRSDTLSWIDSHSPAADKTLAALGIPDYQILAVKNGDDRRYIQITGVYAF